MNNTERRTKAIPAIILPLILSDLLSFRFQAEKALQDSKEFKSERGWILVF
jgi:hypothetical protein